MEPRTLYALIAAALLLPIGAAAADENPERPAATHADAITYKIQIMPAEQWAAPGATVVYRIVAEARANTTLTLAVRAPDGVAATLSAATIELARGAPGVATLSVTSRENASAAKVPIAIVATSQDGEVREARATLVLRGPEHRPEPAAKPHPYANDRAHDRVAELEKRLELLILRAERHLAKLDATEQANATLTLRLSDADATLGEEGRRVAVLIENGPREARVPLHLRVDDASGWKLALEKDGVHLRPYERTYVWVQFHPDGPGRVAYAVSAGPAGPWVQGVASLPAPSTA